MPVSPSYRAYVLEQLSGLGLVAPRSMFGGLGLYHDGLFFGLVDDDTLYLKVDKTTRPDYEGRAWGRSDRRATRGLQWDISRYQAKFWTIGWHCGNGRGRRSRSPAERQQRAGNGRSHVGEILVTPCPSQPRCGSGAPRHREATLRGTDLSTVFCTLCTA
jgi:hypothetical protein